MNDNKRVYLGVNLSVKFFFVSCYYFPFLHSSDSLFAAFIVLRHSLVSQVFRPRMSPTKTVSNIKTTLL